jgi:hypothetical protein
MVWGVGSFSVLVQVGRFQCRLIVISMSSPVGAKTWKLNMKKGKLSLQYMVVIQICTIHTTPTIDNVWAGRTRSSQCRMSIFCKCRPLPVALDEALQATTGDDQGAVAVDDLAAVIVYVAGDGCGQKVMFN